MIETKVCRVGALLIHGIGDQARFDHLQAVGDRIVQSLVATYGSERVTEASPEVKAFFARMMRPPGTS
jgi:hypothetical protein